MKLETLEKRALVHGTYPGGKIGVIKARKHILLSAAAIAQGFGLGELIKIIEHGSKRHFLIGGERVSLHALLQVAKIVVLQLGEGLLQAISRALDGGRGFRMWLGRHLPAR